MYVSIRVVISSVKSHVFGAKDVYVLLHWLCFVKFDTSCILSRKCIHWCMCISLEHKCKHLCSKNNILDFLCIIWNNTFICKKETYLSCDRVIDHWMYDLKNALGPITNLWLYSHCTEQNFSYTTTYLLSNYLLRLRFR